MGSKTAVGGKVVYLDRGAREERDVDEEWKAYLKEQLRWIKRARNAAFHIRNSDAMTSELTDWMVSIQFMLKEKGNENEDSSSTT